jgi:transposase
VHDAVTLDLTKESAIGRTRNVTRDKLRHERDIEIVRAAALEYDAENQRLRAELVEVTRELMVARGRDPEALQLRLKAIEQQLEAARKRLFGRSSERGAKTKDTAEREPQRGHGPREQLELEVVDVSHDLDEADRVCKACGGALRDWEGQSEDSEEVDIIERRFVIKRHRRKKYRCQCGACIETAQSPQKLTPGGRYSIDFALEVAVAKYLDHLPLERQVRIMGREGLVLTSQTLWDQIERLAYLLANPYQRLRRHILQQPVVGADETHWRLMGKTGKDEGPSKRWHIWLVQCSDAVFYSFEDSRSTEAAGRLLDGFAGTVMCDGYAAYGSLKKRGAPIELAHCWSHVRRAFLEIEEFFPNDVGEVLPLIDELFAIERRAATGPPGDDERRQSRANESAKLVEQIRQWAFAKKPLPQSGLHKAISYMLGLWEGLVRFVGNPRIPLTNNASERAARGPVVGRKNHYGSRSERGTEVAAIFYSLLESAKLAGIEPKAYLRNAVRLAISGEEPPLPHELATVTPV